MLFAAAIDSAAQAPARRPQTPRRSQELRPGRPSAFHRSNSRPQARAGLTFIYYMPVEARWSYIQVISRAGSIGVILERRDFEAKQRRSESTSITSHEGTSRRNSFVRSSPITKTAVA